MVVAISWVIPGWQDAAPDGYQILGWFQDAACKQAGYCRGGLVSVMGIN
jgi:hypothetical protein